MTSTLPADVIHPVTGWRNAQPCAMCGLEICHPDDFNGYGIGPTYVHAATGTYRGPGGDGKTALAWHLASPVPRCPKCRSTRYTGRDEAWGISHDCADCGYHHYFSIGD